MVSKTSPARESLINLGEADSTRQKQAKQQSLAVINKYKKIILNTAMAILVINQYVRRYLSLTFILSFIFCIASVPTQASTLTASVDRNTISSQETLTLLIELNEQSLMSEPDFSGLNKDFEILSTGKSSNINFINGKFNGVTQWKIELLPKRSGKLIIPALVFDKLKSKPIEITVTDTPSQNFNTQNHDDIFVETNVDKKTAYIQEQILFTVKLFHQSQQISNWGLSEPEINNAHVIKFEQPKQYYAMVNGVRYGVLEKNYVIFPEKSGSLNLPAIRFNGIISDAGSHSRFGFNQGKRIIRDAKPIKLTIKPIPDSFTGKTWLPASDVTIGETWSPDKMRLTVGEPITRTIMLRAKGSLGSHIPPIQANLPQSIKQYPDQADISDELQYNGILGTRTESTALIPLQQEELNLPAVRIPWWDTDEDKLKYAKLPSRKLSIAAGNSPSTPASNKSPVKTDPQTQNINTPSISQKTNTEFNGWKVFGLISSLLNIIVLTALIYLLKAKWPGSNKPSAKNKAPNLKTSRLNQLNKIKKQLLKACTENNAKSARHKLIQWAQIYFENNQLYSLDEIIQQLHDKELQKRIQQLEHALYGGAESKAWHGEKLANALKVLPEAAKKVEKNHEQLPDFYPISS